MNMNDKIKKRMLAGVVAVTVGVASFGAYEYSRPRMSSVRAGEDTEKLKEAAEEVLGDSTSEKTKTFFKDESVYVKADAAGNVEETTVTEWLKNPGKGELTDSSELQDIENIKGEETFEKGKDGELVWKADGEDIYYQGTTKKELPVEVKVSYKLNGKSVTAENLKGKDGKVEIHIDYINKSKEKTSVNKKKVEMYTPFTVVTALMLPTEEYKNVSIDNGKVISDADKDIVVGLAFPGLKENLKLDKLDVNIPESVTITADVKKASIGPTVTVASADVIDKLGFDKVNDFDSFEDSIGELDGAAKQLVSGSGELADGANTLNSKAAELTSGVNEVANGVNAYVGGVNELAAGSEQLTAGADSLRQGAATAQQGIASAKSGADTLVANYDAVVGGANSLSAGLKELSGALDQGGISAPSIDVSGALSGALSGEIGGLAAQMASEAAAGITDDAFQAMGMTRDQYIGALTRQYGQELSGMLSGIGPKIEGQISGTIQEVEAQVQGSMNTIKQNVDALSAGADSLATGVGQLKNGTVQLQGGLAQLNDGSGALVQGTNDLYNGAYALQQGAAKLNDAGSVLQVGTEKLQNGGAQFADGVNQLAGGSNTLASGMNEFKTSGIDRLTEVFNGDIKNVTARIDAMKKLGEKYSSFAGMKEDADGSTKFIIETKGIE